MAFDSPLNVIIVGAGIAGLAAARALRERHNVTIIDQSRLKNEVGAAIHIGPNASGILLKLGLSTERVGSVFCNHVIERTYENTTQIDFKFDAEEQWGSPWLLNHRADLHSELYRLATDFELSGTHPEKYLGCAVESCDPVAGNVRLANGRVISGDVIIGTIDHDDDLTSLGADGIHSVIRESIIGKYLPGVRSGHSAYRFLIDSSKLREDSELAFLVEDGTITSFVAQTRRIVCYPCRNLELLNVVAMLPDTLLYEESVANWNVDGSVEEMLKSFAEFDPTIKRIFRLVTVFMLKS
jgi:salicylate hydroxylase